MVMGEMVRETDLLVIGSGPGGYGAAFRAADLGLEVTMVDPSPRPGGVCLYHGCIPSKTLLELAELIDDAGRADGKGISFGAPVIEVAGVRRWRDQVIEALAGGLATLCEQRAIELITARARFEDSRTVRLSDSAIRRVSFRTAVIATGSRPLPLPGLTSPIGRRIMDSGAALSLEEIPASMLVVGGGYIGLEIGLAYAGLGTSVRLVEAEDRLLGGVDRDLVAPLARRLSRSFQSIRLGTRVSQLKEEEGGVEVTLEGGGGTATERVDRVLVAIGRAPNSGDLGLDTTGIGVAPGGGIVVDHQQRTAEHHIFAVGDVTGGAMLAHKAIREGRVAAEVSAGQPSAFDVRAMPAVVYTDPQIAWCGLTEEQAVQQGITVTVRKFPWKYSGRAGTMDCTDGLTKIIAEPDSGRVLGFGAVGRQAEGLVSEGVVAVEMGALVEDLALCLHPHPTLSETVGEAAELFLGSSTHILARKRVSR